MFLPCINKSDDDDDDDLLHETRNKTNIKYNNFSGLPVEMQLLKASK